MKTKKITLISALLMAISLAAILTTPVWAKPASSQAPLTQQDLQQYYDELDYQRAVQTYLWSIPAMYMYSLRQSLSETFGATGPDKGKGGKYLVLPPGYEGDVPDEGYFVVKSPTYGVMVCLRGYIEDGSTANAVALIKKTKIYPLAEKDNPRETTFINVSGKPVNTLSPTDERLFYNLADLVQQEAIAEKDMHMYGMLASIGIEKGKPFNPDERMLKILKRVATTAHGMVRSFLFSPRADNAWYYEGKHWTLPFLTPNARFEVDGRSLLDERTAFFYGAFGTSAGMVKSFEGKGSKYINTFTDKTGAFLMGENTYKLVMPANVPAKDFWSLTIYDADTRSMLKNGTRFQMSEFRISDHYYDKRYKIVGAERHLSSPVS